ncbi:SCO2322 family protein [Arsenicicoccus piscis]|uniref:Gram-positive cocci surface proteins LPxTG domain-containing protein n=1 Tax=Arsenicicoccus piscis TaxID=673954 RepID=A0ABQ6HQG1_9MICO|nr:SCO2322 family protein [Arsenicicoccus piscis]MCH8628506.1 SCO2322 family protein [Arsenicicoccus piscis]GMA19919.1 hypothetical protein GCM10025862_19400 [Arsenicicoccus piscis]
MSPTSARPQTQHAVRVLVALLAVLVSLTVLPAPSAQAAGGYRYWGYWQLAGAKWGFSSNGPSMTHPGDGSVEGWRFAVAAENSMRVPRATVTFAQACSTTPAVDGKKRVAVVIDFGRSADAADEGTTPPKPYYTCVSAPMLATGQEVLAAAADVRFSNSGMVCGVGGYPTAGCSEQVATISTAAAAADTPVPMAFRAAPGATPSPAAAATTTGGATAAPSAPATPAASDSQSSGGSNATTLIVLAVVVLALIGGLIAMTRRRRNA